MRTVLQRVSRASVSVAGEVVARLDLADGEHGLVLLVGVGRDDGPDQVAALVRKAAELRVLRGERSALDVGAPVLVVSQFTLQGDVRRGRRPSWSAAAPGEVAEPLVDAVASGLRARGLVVATGRFGADMAVDLVGDGPVTLVLDT
ncbi:D-aminoacyl-tRNA deacylase [Pseudokineococcus basanitobsidens]|uniref:D-aminoacyl-tRNA deacylase n=1 Tax=Pseudokineococcus basanitobsidens TaxID=1926649 RepID=A0ABU8RGF2_9ACTN